MKLAPGQREKLRRGVSEALAFRLFIALKNKRKRPTFAECEAELADIKALSGQLLAGDALHAAICDRFVAAVEEGLI